MHQQQDHVPAIESAEGAGWTEARTDLLKQLWADGLSSGKIAKALGGVTRNAVVGKANRLGLEGKNRAVQAKPQRYAGRPKKKKATAGLDAIFKSFKKTDMDAVSEEDAAIPRAQRRSLQQLNSETCRWPIGDPRAPEFFFCGAKPQSTGPYCEPHARCAYQPSRQRKETLPPLRRAA